MSEKMKQKRDQKRVAMISDFIKVFCEQGLDGTYMRKLASSTGVSEALLYRYFENKDDIIKQCVIQYHEQIQRELTGVFRVYLHQPENLPERILFYVDQVIDVCRFLLQVMAHPKYSSIMEETVVSVNQHIYSIAALFQEQMGADWELALGASFMMNSLVNDYILKKSRENFLVQFEAMKRLIWKS